MPDDLTVLLCRTPQAVSPEWAWGQTLCEEFLRQTLGNACLLVLEGPSPLTVSEVLKTTRSAALGVVLDDILFWSPVGWETLCQVLAHSPCIGVVGPVSDKTTVPEQKVAPPFLYQTPALFRLACQEHHRLYQGQWREVPALDPFAFLVRRAGLEELDPKLPLSQVPASLSQKGRTLAVALDTYVHRYAPMYEQPRPDLQAWVPREAKRILDIGCAAGVFGAALKARQACHVVGIEANSLLVAAAAKRLDRVIQADVEVIAPTTLTAEFDCIVCGDVLEHLRDPWSLVAKLAAWLRPGGQLIATLPNVGHWSIVADLLQGRWDLIPFGLLCWGHLRFFTRSGVERLFAGHGLTVELLQGLTEEPSPAQEAFLQKALALFPDVDRESLRTGEFLVIACKPGG